MNTGFEEAISRAPLTAFQLATALICMLLLMCEGVDIQLLGIVAPVVMKDYGVDKSTFGIAMSAALVGMGIGAWLGGWQGDAIGRRYSLALAALVFGLATIAAGASDSVWHMAGWRLLGGLGFGSAFSNALAMTSEWLPERWRPVAISTLSVGTPAGGAVAGALVPTLLADYGWRGTFVAFGGGTLILVVIILAVLRDSPLFLLAKGRLEEANRLAQRIFGREIALRAAAPESLAARQRSAGVLHRSNLRLNLGVGLSFAAATLIAYGVLNWSTTLLTSKGLPLSSASYAIFVAGITSIVGSVGSGVLVRSFGSRRVLATVSIALFVALLVLAVTLEVAPDAPMEGSTGGIVVLIGLASAAFSCAISTIYVIITLGYPQSCRSAGIGFGIFTGRVGAILASGFGGVLLELGHGSTIVFFGVLMASAAIIGGAAFIIDRHVSATR